MKHISVNCIEHIPLLTSADCPKLIKDGFYAVNNGSFDEAKNFFKKALSDNPESAEANFGLLLAEQNTNDASRLAYCVLDKNEMFEKAVTLSSGSFKDFLLCLKQLNRLYTQSLECDAAAADCNAVRSRLKKEEKEILEKLKKFHCEPNTIKLFLLQQRAERRGTASKVVEVIIWILICIAGIIGLVHGFNYATTACVDIMNETDFFLAQAIIWLIAAVLGIVIGAALFMIPVALVFALVISIFKISSADCEKEAKEISEIRDAIYRERDEKRGENTAAFLQKLRELSDKFEKAEYALSVNTEIPEDLELILKEASYAIKSIKAFLTANNSIHYLNDELLSGAAKILVKGEANLSMEALKAYEQKLKAQKEEQRKKEEQAKKKAEDEARAKAASESTYSGSSSQGHSEYYDRKYNEYLNNYLGRSSGTSSASSQAKGASDQWSDLNSSGYWDDKSWQ